MDTPIELAMIKKIVEDDGGSFEEIELIPIQLQML
jgi:nitrogen fixation/metabolism regulation signal transduction histidine kinase